MSEPTPQPVVLTDWEIQRLDPNIARTMLRETQAELARLRARLAEVERERDELRAELDGLIGPPAREEAQQREGQEGDLKGETGHSPTVG